MADASTTRGAIKFIVSAAIVAALIAYLWVEYYNGTLISWYYYQAASDGWAINSDAFKNASKDEPASLEIGSFQKIEGLQAVPVKKGERLPPNTNGVIDEKTVQEGKRVTLEGNTLKVTVPYKLRTTAGFKVQGILQAQGYRNIPVGRSLERGFYSCPRTCIRSHGRRIHGHVRIQD